MRSAPYSRPHDEPARRRPRRAGRTRSTRELFASEFFVATVNRARSGRPPASPLQRLLPTPRLPAGGPAAALGLAGLGAGPPGWGETAARAAPPRPGPPPGGGAGA